MSDVTSVRQANLHPHRLPTLTKWRDQPSNRHEKMVSVDLDADARKAKYAEQRAQVSMAHARWAAGRHVSNVRQYGVLLGDARYIAQVMKSYKVEPRYIEYAVAKTLLGILAKGGE